MPACNAPPRHAVQRKQTGAASARRDTADPERLAQRACAARHLALELPPALTASVRCEPLQNEGRGSRQLQHRFWIQTNDKNVVLFILICRFSTCFTGLPLLYSCFPYFSPARVERTRQTQTVVEWYKVEREEGEPFGDHGGQPRGTRACLSAVRSGPLRASWHALPCACCCPASKNFCTRFEYEAGLRGTRAWRVRSRALFRRTARDAGVESATPGPGCAWRPLHVRRETGPFRRRALCRTSLQSTAPASCVCGRRNRGGLVTPGRPALRNVQVWMTACAARAGVIEE